MELDAEDMKRELLQKSAKHREELEGDVRLVTENTEKLITNALIIGGSLALTYYLVTKLSGSPKKKHRGKARKIKVVQPSPVDGAEDVEEEEVSSHPGMLGQVGTALASQASLFLLNLAKEKVMEYLQTMGEPKKEG
jgi:hypothetical protein